MDKFTFSTTGGIGDLLLCRGGINALIEQFGEDNLKCVVFSHFKDAASLMKGYNFPIESYHYQSEADFQQRIVPKLRNLEFSTEGYLGDVRKYNDTMYPDIEVPDEYRTEKEPERIHVVIHPFGSPYSNEFLTNTRCVPPKDLTVDFVKEIVTKWDPQSEVYFSIIGHPSEYWFFEELMVRTKGGNINEIFVKDIWYALAAVESADLLIGADSAMKSFSAIKKVPSIVVLGGYEDRVRDSKFITPYQNDDIIHPVHFSEEADLNLDLALSILEKSKEVLA
jgi:hypothetical protein